MFRKKNSKKKKVYKKLLGKVSRIKVLLLRAKMRQKLNVIKQNRGPTRICLCSSFIVLQPKAYIRVQNAI